MRRSILLFCILCSACVHNEEYPSDWSPVVAEDTGCPDISGIYDNAGLYASTNKTSFESGYRLTDYLQESGLEAWVFLAYVVISQSEADEIEVTAHSRQKVYETHTLSRELGHFECEDGRIWIADTAWGGPHIVLVGRVNYRIGLAKAEDGSLVGEIQSDGGGVAFLVTSEERARDLRQTPARIAHATQAVPFETETVTNFYHADLTRFDSGLQSAADLYERTGLGPEDIQVGMLYDHFTIAVFWHLEACGFCGPGEAADFVKEGHLALDGSIPLSPNGGLIGEAYIHGMNLVTEAVRQIRGTAANPVADVEHVLLSAGMSAAILERC